MTSSIIIPNIPTHIENSVIKKQHNKCARKPYYMVNGLENYNCILWKKNKNKGTFINKQYTIYKKDPSGDATISNLIALCDQCFKVLQNRTNRNNNIAKSDSSSSDSNLITESDSSSVEDLIICNSDSLSEEILDIVSKKYIVVYYPNEPGIVNIRKSPSIGADVIGNAYYGDIFDVNQIINNKWIQIIYDTYIGYIQIMCNKYVFVSEYINAPINKESNNSPSVPECKICYEELLIKYVFIPCGHACICKPCIDKLNICPICSVKIKKTQRIFD